MPRRKEETTVDETYDDDDETLIEEDESEESESESETEAQEAAEDDEDEDEEEEENDNNKDWEFKSISYMLAGSPQKLEHLCSKEKKKNGNEESDKNDNSIKVKLDKKIFNRNEDSGKNVIGGAWLTDYKSSYDCAISISYEHDNVNNDEDSKQIQSYSHSHDKRGQFTILPGMSATGQKIPLRKEQKIPEKTNDFLKKYKNYNSSNLNNGITDILDSKESLVVVGHPVLDMIAKFKGAKPGKSGLNNMVTVNKEHKDKSLVKLQELYDKAFTFHSLDDFVITANRHFANKWDDLHEISERFGKGTKEAKEGALKKPSSLYVNVLVKFRKI